CQLCDYGCALSRRLRATALALCFFQAEDGIRDLIVTGVQTCALPISPVWPTWRCTTRPSSCSTPASSGRRASRSGRRGRAGSTQIGRASCRERVLISGFAVLFYNQEKIIHVLLTRALLYSG